MKKPLYYAIRTGALYNPVIAVTSEKGHRWHGREERTNMPTHGVLSDLSGRFETAGAAELKRAAIGEVADAYDELRKKLSRARSDVDKLEREAVAELLADREAPPVPKVVRVGHGFVSTQRRAWTVPGTGLTFSHLGEACQSAGSMLDRSVGGFILVGPESKLGQQT
jgi:hypothetical protein